MEDNSFSSSRVKVIRTNLGLSQEEFAKLCKTTKRTIQDWEQNERKLTLKYYVRLNEVERMDKEEIKKMFETDFNVRNSVFAIGENNSVNNHDYKTTIDNLIAIIKEKDRQIEEKDKQISNLFALLSKQK